MFDESRGISNEMDDKSISNFDNSGICFVNALKLNGFKPLNWVK